MTTQAVWDLPAKANRKNPDEWLPLWMHLRDTAAVMDYLISVWLPDSVKKTIDPAGNEEQLRKTAVLLSALHDLGKATPAFCSMILQNIDGIENQLEGEGLPISGYKVFTSRKASTTSRIAFVTSRANACCADDFLMNIAAKTASFV